MSTKSQTFETKEIAEKRAREAHKQASLSFGYDNVSFRETTDAFILVRPEPFDGVVTVRYEWK